MHRTSLICPEPLSIISQFGFPTSGVRSSFIKEILRREFKGRIGFLSGGGSYIIMLKRHFLYWDQH